MKKNFLIGLVILLPVAITLAVAGYLINFFTGPFVTAVSSFLKRAHLINDGFLFLSHDQVVTYISKLLILICLFFVIVLLGMLTRWYFIRLFLNFWDWLLQKIPVVRTVYKLTREIIKSFFMPDKNAFRQVVLVPFPRKDMFALGLVSGTAPTVCSESLGSPLITVLIPTTPNPITGFLLMYKPEDLVYIDMKPEEAIKYIISCGAMAPTEKRLI